MSLALFERIAFAIIGLLVVAALVLAKPPARICEGGAEWPSYSTANRPAAGGAIQECRLTRLWARQQKERPPLVRCERP